MAVLSRGFLQRIVGALVLLAIAVIFLPMLFTREDEPRPLRLDVPAEPISPGMPNVQAEPIELPVLVSEPAEEVEEVTQVVVEAAPAPAPAPAPEIKAPVAETVKPQRLDANQLPVSWSVQLASVSNRANAEALQQRLRAQGYNAYIRHVDGMNRVMVGPVIERKEAERLRDQISRQNTKDKLSGIVVRFEPERR